MVDWNKIKLFIKHDGKVPKSKEEIYKEKMQAEMKEKQRQKQIQFDREKKVRRYHRLRNDINIDQKALDALQFKADNWDINYEEHLLDNELEYMDKMYSECKKCGSDILDINGTCSANKCGAYKDKQTWGIDKRRIFE